MLQVVGVAETNDFGDQPPDGGVLVMGVKYMFAVSPINPIENGFTEWMWRLYLARWMKEAEELAYSDDSTFVPEGELSEKAVLMTIRDAAKQLAFSATETRHRALELEGRESTGMAEVHLLQRRGHYAGVMLAEEMAEFAESVETYLWYQRWLCGY